MADDKFTVFIQGPEGNKDSLSLKHFVDLLGEIKRGLGHLDHLISRQNETTMKYLVTNLSHSSPFCVKFSAVPIKREAGPDFSSEIIASFIGGLNMIESEEKLPDLFDYQMCEVTKKIGKIRKNVFSEITIKNSTASVSVTSNLESKVDVLLGEDREANGSVEGMLEKLNIHGSKNELAIYPYAGAEKIECKFPESMFPEIKLGIGKSVKIIGKLKYKTRAKFPHQAIIEKMSVCEDEDNIPPLRTIIGSAPQMLEGLSTLEFIEKIRKDDE